MSDLDRLVLATANPGKVAELVELLGGRYGIEGRPADLPETVEDGDTLEANATKKAREVADHVGVAALADDTGLFIDALDGRPGVRTARYAGPGASADDNIDKLLGELAGRVDRVDRGAEFRTVMALCRPGEPDLLVEGRVRGWIAPERRGTAGFGYDPVFIPAEGDGRSFAEMSSVEKADLSHRGRAIAALLAAL